MHSERPSVGLVNLGRPVHPLGNLGDCPNTVGRGRESLGVGRGAGGGGGVRGAELLTINRMGRGRESLGWYGGE